MTVKVFAAHVYWNYLGLFVSVMDVYNHFVTLLSQQICGLHLKHLQDGWHPVLRVCAASLFMLLLMIQQKYPCRPNLNSMTFYGNRFP